MFRLDTNTLSELWLERGHSELFRRLRFHRADSLFTSAVCVMDLRSGARKKNDGGALWEGIEATVLPRVQVLDLGEEEALLAGDLRSDLERRGRPIQTEDLLIAATALVRGYTVVTHNVRHFSPIPGLKVQDWLA
jgi:tRNA(fMet)-specific endonuclease VapC